MFAIGIAIRGRLAPFDFSDPLVALAAVADLGIGLSYFIASALGYGGGDVRAVTYEYGCTFLIVAGLLDLLVVIDAYDTAMGREGPARRDAKPHRAPDDLRVLRLADFRGDCEGRPARAAAVRRPDVRRLHRVRDRPRLADVSVPVLIRRRRHGLRQPSARARRRVRRSHHQSTERAQRAECADDRRTAPRDSRSEGGCGGGRRESHRCRW